ncbi:nitrilase-related carbon-nitrogen hydrolase [Mesotoga sp. BH458_6_3_2_1]|uniref:nitrilase-related carbon-nitrogen hydrolase n=1 Tax=Mesotoga sp. BH458_6_3_2_1 TaxID=1437446 RepID=UPI000EF19300|nr:nitrilase-related carbon-nitrogen hydrolase [Mesotoga sp. BH458_6_3_2_1]RLL82958.1 nitrilase [Mesotoga sp. BH458_6_3_2_1]
MRIGGVPLNIVWESPEINMKIIERLFAGASEAGVELIVFPETALSGFTPNAEKAYVRDACGFFKKQVDHWGIPAVYGFIDRRDSKFYNCAAFLSLDSEPLIYRKRKLFSYGGENIVYSPGDTNLSFKMKNIHFSLNICYDLRFPELFRANLPAEVMIVIANWPEKRANHWQALLKARAIENQSFVLGLNRTGVDGNGIEYDEAFSVLFDQDGNEVPFEAEKGLLLWELDYERMSILRDWRERFPALKDI